MRVASVLRYIYVYEMIASYGLKTKAYIHKKDIDLYMTLTNSID